MCDDLRYDAYPTGRKNCSTCGAWKQLHHFSRGSRGYLQAACTTCKRLRYRAKHDAKPKGPATHCQQGHEMTPENTASNGKGRRMCRKCMAVRARLPEVKEYHRIYKEARRRKAGIPPRPLGPKGRPTPKNRENPHRVPAGPFIEWAKERIEWHDCTKEEFAARIGVNPRQLYGYLYGEYKEVHIDIVDKALINEMGSPYLLNEMYPVED